MVLQPGLQEEFMQACGSRLAWAEPVGRVYAGLCESAGLLDEFMQVCGSQLAWT